MCQSGRRYLGANGETPVGIILKDWNRGMNTIFWAIVLSTSICMCVGWRFFLSKKTRTLLSLKKKTSPVFFSHFFHWSCNVPISIVGLSHPPGGHHRGNGGTESRYDHYARWTRLFGYQFGCEMGGVGPPSNVSSSVHLRFYMVLSKTGEAMWESQFSKDFLKQPEIRRWHHFA